MALWKAGILLVLFAAKAFADIQVDSLYALKQALNDPRGYLETWNPYSMDPCTWLYITCDEFNNVIKVSLAASSLSGTLVPDIANLKSLKYLELFDNNISGALPSELGSLAQLVSLNLNHNSLTGSIPSSFGGLKSLVFLRLNNNHLSGSIPSSLTTIALLQVLDLSYNQLEGAVPWQGCFLKFSSESFVANPRLCGQVVRKSCS